jgi:hypothetical protein
MPRVGPVARASREEMERPGCAWSWGALCLKGRGFVRSVPCLPAWPLFPGRLGRLARPEWASALLAPALSVGALRFHLFVSIV